VCKAVNLENMAWYTEYSDFQFGKHKGKKVRDVNDKEYIDWLHHSDLNVYFMPDVLERLGIENRGKKPHHNHTKSAR